LIFVAGELLMPTNSIAEDFISFRRGYISLRTYAAGIRGSPIL